MAQHLRKWLIFFVLAVAAVVAGTLYLQKLRADEQLGLAASRTLSEVFRKDRSLRVATLSGEVLAKGSDPGWIDLLTTTMTVKYPYQVDYFVNLTQIDASSYRWDAETRTMTVRIPDVIPATPNIDASKVKYLSTGGIWVSRGASQRLNVQVATRAKLRAANSAAKREHFDRARASAREAMQVLVTAPLRAANLGQVNVNVVFTWEPAWGGVPLPVS